MVAFDAVGPAGGGGTSFTTSPGTWTHVNNGNGILVGITCVAGSSNTVTGVTYGGVTVPLLKYQVSDSTVNGGISFYGLTGPSCPTGSNTVSVSFSDAGSNHNAGSVSVSGAGGLGTPASAAASVATSVSVSVAGTTLGGLIVATACFGGGSGSGVFSGTNGVTVRWSHNNNNSSSADNGTSGTVASAGGAQTVGFSNTQSDDWGIVAVEVLPGGGGGIPQMREQRRGSKARHRHGYQRQQQMASFADAGQPAAAVPPGLLQFPVTVPDSVSW